MPFNGSGTFSLVAGNPVVTGTVISSTWANNTLQDISANGLSKCVTIDGQSTTTSSVPFAAGISVTTGITTPSTTVALFNTTATTVNAFGAATALNMGAVGGTLTFGGAIYNQKVTRATVDQSITTNVTLASATNMSFSIGASEEWVADFALDIGTNLTVHGLKLGVTIPASATLNAIAFVGTGFAFSQASDSVTVRRTTTGGAALDFTSTNLVASNADGLVSVSIWVLNSTNAGTVQLQIAQSTSSGTALVLRKGSHMRANRVA